MKLDIRNVKPFVTLSVFESSEASSIVDEVKSKINEILQTLPQKYHDYSHGDIQAYFLEPLHDNGYYASAFCYKIESLPSWIGSDNQNAPGEYDYGIVDTKYHLVILASYRDYIIIYSSHELMRDRVNEIIQSGFLEAINRGKTISISISRSAKSISRQKIESAFVKGETKSTWLEGLHQSTIMKPDRKILIGPNLRYAFDRFGDQTYKYSAVISELSLKSKYRVGVSFEKNTIWRLSVKNFDEFINESRHIIDILSGDVSKSNENEESGLPFLSNQIHCNLRNLKDAFEVYYSIPDNTTIQEIVSAGNQVMTIEQVDGYNWYKHGSFIISEESEFKEYKYQVIAEAYYDQCHLATIRFSPCIYNENKIDIKFEVIKYIERKDDYRLVEFDRAMKKRNFRLTIRYSSGQIFQNGLFYEQKFVHVIFDKWRWLYFDNEEVDIRKEKPEKETIDINGRPCYVYDPSKLGKTDSLFCYVYNKTVDFIHNVLDKKLSDKCLILCDDGAGEIADFIIIDPDKQNRLTIFIHIKAAKGTITERISIGELSTLCTMAQKNINNLDPKELCNNIRVRNEKRKAHLIKSVYNNSVTLDIFLNTLEEMFSGSEKHVILLLPKNKKSAWIKAKEDHINSIENQDVYRMRELSNLLGLTEVNLKNLEATLTVVGSNN